MQVRYKLDRGANPQHIITAQARWHKLPQLLEVMREIPLNIRRAYIHENSSTFVVTSGSPYLSTADIDKHMETLERTCTSHEITYVETSLWNKPRIELPIDSKVLIYNFQNKPYTTMEFSCKDRVGLLSDLLQFMTELPVDIHDAIITTIGNHAHNILHLQNQNQPLESHQISYIRNVFEYDIKPRFLDNNELM